MNNPFSLLRNLLPAPGLTRLDLDTPHMRADFESNAPTGVEDLPSMSDVEAWEQLLIGLKTSTGQIVTPERARRCGATLACMRILTEDLSSLRRVLYKRGKNGPEEAIDHPLYRLLDVAPNDIMTPVEVMEHIIFDLVMWGNFYVLKNMDPASGEVVSLWPLQAAYVTRLNRQMVWSFTDPVTGMVGEFSPDMVWRGSIMSTNAIDGWALTLLARDAIGMLLAAEEQGARLFKQGVQTDLALSTAETVDEDQKKQLRAAFMQRHAGSGNAFMPIVLEGGLTASRIGLTAQESQYLEARAFQAQEIFRIFRVPEVLAGSTGKSSRSSTYASAEQFFQSYTKHTLTPWAVRLEQTMHRDLLTIKEQSKYFVQHDFSSLLRADTAGRYASYAVGIDKGFISPADARKSENMPWVAGLDYYNKPMNMDSAGVDPEGKVAPTDQSGSLPRNVAHHILGKEQKAIVGQKQDADVFYTLFGGYVEDLTGADPSAVLTYLALRRATADRFSAEATTIAIEHLISLCKKDK